MILTELRSSSPRVIQRLGRHPLLKAPVLPGPDLLSWIQDGWKRRITVQPGGIGGLTEIADNNPFVCADEVGQPQGAEALLLIAMGPLIRAGVLMERPAIVSSVEFDTERGDAWLGEEGWTEGATVTVVDSPDPRVIALTLMVPLPPEVDRLGLEDLFDERFGREYFVRRATSELDGDRIVGTPFAEYRLDYQDGLAVVRTVADPDGKGGSDAVVHAFNVMIGAEETLGLL